MEVENKEKIEDGEKTENAKDDCDPYAYLNRGEFSSENYKIEVKNMPKFYGISVKKILIYINSKCILNNVNILRNSKNC